MLVEDKVHARETTAIYYSRNRLHVLVAFAACTLRRFGWIDWLIAMTSDRIVFCTSHTSSSFIFDRTDAHKKSVSKLIERWPQCMPLFIAKSVFSHGETVIQHSTADIDGGTQWRIELAQNVWQLIWVWQSVRMLAAHLNVPFNHKLALSVCFVLHSHQNKLATIY